MAEADAEGGGRSAAPPDDEYECKICYNYYDLERRRPKVLGCSHTFCLECLDTLHFREGRGWRVACPVCRHRTPVPEYRVHNLPDNTELTEALPLREPPPVDAEQQTGPSVSDAASSESRCETCKQVAFCAFSVCAILSFLSMVVFLFLGLIFVHDNHITYPFGPVCLFVASILALSSLILTWLTCMLKHRSETEASNFGSLTSNMM